MCIKEALVGYYKVSSPNSSVRY